MARMDFSSTNDGFEEFKKFVEGYKSTDKMKLVIIGGKDVVLRTRLATKYDSAYIKNLSESQIKDLEKFVDEKIEIWHVERFYWDEEVKEKKVE